MLRRAFLLTSALVAFAGCTSAKKAYHQASADLSDAVIAYHDGVRTGEFDRCLKFIATADRPAFFDAVTKLAKDRRFTEARVAATEYPQGASEATVTVTRSYYLLNELTEKQETVNQTWLWKAKELRWQLKWDGKP
jgi:hypothetical protein